MGIAEDIALFEQNLNELIIKYDQYFLGLEKREPLRLLEEVERMSRRYVGVAIPNTMHKFKLTSLVAKFNSYRQNWTRNNRLLEEGKHPRDRFRAAKSLSSASADDRESDATIKSSDDAAIAQLYQQFIAARRACQLATDSVTPDLIATAIAQQKPAIIAKYGCRDVEFKVAVENGVPKIKARPRP